MLYTSVAEYDENLSHHVVTDNPSADPLRTTRKIMGVYSRVLPAPISQPTTVDSVVISDDGIGSKQGISLARYPHSPTLHNTVLNAERRAR